MADEHKTVLLSIFATLLSAGIMFAALFLINGGFSVTLFKGYVLPLLVSAFTLSVFAGVLFARSKGKIPGFEPTEESKDKKPSAPAQK